MAAHKPVEWVQAVINRFDEQKDGGLSTQAGLGAREPHGECRVLTRPSLNQRGFPPNGYARLQLPPPPASFLTTSSSPTEAFVLLQSLHSDSEEDFSAFWSCSVALASGFTEPQSADCAVA
ncbi:hypothetical protein SKAU_G00272970 [Synaphobranchus kaupii]|uniref:Uncharacterized protein n=1 Tax=Synaphobranchus kaupii TaxID=118154 RepID=A0A9Q1F0P6_SYNKA|nr:hypothetical protein SKAU_G00272970 [Synaphobranchus kaupii]